MRRLALTALLAVLLLVPAGARAELPPVKHVLVIVMENENYKSTFGDGTRAPKVPYLAKDLAAKGALLPNYFAIGHLSVTDYIAMISGQAPNPITQSDCLIFQEFMNLGKGPDGQSLGLGCVYPREVSTLADQLDAKGLTWKGYMEDQSNAPAGQPKTCRHPPLGSQDPTITAKKGDQYATRHNPFMYFRSIIDDKARCEADVVDFGRLGDDLGAAGTVPNFGFISPNLCNDGHDEPCADGRPGGMTSANDWLADHVPGILDSPAMRDDGLLMVTFDEAESGGSSPDSTACCGGQTPPTTPDPGSTAPGAGGGRVGAVLISPFIRPGTVSSATYNHYGFLRSVEDLYNLDHLGYAGAAATMPFGTDVFNRTPALSLGVRPGRLRKRSTKATLRIAVDHPAAIKLEGACARPGTLMVDTRVNVRFKRGLRRRGRCRITAERPGYEQASKSLRVR